MTRRAALLAAAAAPLGACSLGATGNGTPARQADPDLTLRARAAQAERALIARYQATADVHPDLQEPLGTFIARHQRHLEELLATGGASDLADVAADVPTARAEAITALREAETNHATERIEDSIASIDYELARVLASVAACETAHDYLLGELA